MKILNKGIIDIGTNSTRLLIIDLNEGTPFKRIYKDLRVTRIGRGLADSGRISEAAIARTTQALKTYLDMCKSYNCDDVYCFGTAALRESKNQQDIVERVDQKLGLKIDVISGTQEAQYGFLGASASFEQPIRILDVGGGSTELVNGVGTQVGPMVSMNMGCVRFTEAYLHSDPPTATQLQELKGAVVQTLEENTGVVKDRTERQLVSIGGTATTIATMLMQLKDYDGDAIHLKVVKKHEILALIEEMKGLPLQSRKERIGLDPTRADIILAGLVITLETMTALYGQEMVICDWDNLEGAAVARYINK